MMAIVDTDQPALEVRVVGRLSITITHSVAKKNRTPQANDRSAC
jgi:hypothetical protein